MHALLVLPFFVTCFQSDFHVSSHITLHRAQVPHVKKKKKSQRIEDKLISLMKKVCCQLSLFFTDSYTNLVRVKNENQVAKWKTKESGFSLKDKKSQFSLTLEPRFRSTNFKPILIKRRIQELNGIIESQRREIDHTVAGDEQLRRDQLLLHEQLSEQNLDLGEAHMKSLYEVEEMKRVQGSRFDGHGDGVPKACRKQAAADSRGSRTCVCANT